jgi:trans-2-enoyl-CoA reductase
MTKALICKSAGQWREVLELREVSLPPKPAAGMARIKMLAAAVHPSDFGMIAGTYGKAKTFPCVMGREGVGEVVALGSLVEDPEHASISEQSKGAAPQTNSSSIVEGARGWAKVGDIVRIPEETGAWAEVVDVPAQNLIVCPRNLNLKPQQLALSFINPPTALRILEDFVELKAGDVVITNAGKSAVSQAFIQLARQRGLKPCAVVRGKTPEDEAWLKSLGAEMVFDEEEEYFKFFSDPTPLPPPTGTREGDNKQGSAPYLVAAQGRPSGEGVAGRSPENKFRSLREGLGVGLPKPLLALNQIGGESVLKLIKSLGAHGTCVTIGGAAKEPVRYPTRELIFKDVALRGFWMDRWLKEHPDEARAMMGKIWGLMREGKLTQEVAGEFKLAEFKNALEMAEGKRRGKILFVA